MPFLTVPLLTTLEEQRKKTLEESVLSAGNWKGDDQENPVM